jgi:hypothetical protein
MKTTNKAGKFLNFVLAAAVLATGYFASAGVSQAGWIYTNHGYVYCNIANGVRWCN